jgi:hypothetical protein
MQKVVGSNPIIRFSLKSPQIGSFSWARRVGFPRSFSRFQPSACISKARRDSSNSCSNARARRRIASCTFAGSPLRRRRRNRAVPDLRDLFLGDPRHTTALAASASPPQTRNARPATAPHPSARLLPRAPARSNRPANCIRSGWKPCATSYRCPAARRSSSTSLRLVRSGSSPTSRPSCPAHTGCERLRDLSGPPSRLWVFPDLRSKEGTDVSAR